MLYFCAWCLVFDTQSSWHLVLHYCNAAQTREGYESISSTSVNIQNLTFEQLRFNRDVFLWLRST